MSGQLEVALELTGHLVKLERRVAALEAWAASVNVNAAGVQDQFVAVREVLVIVLAKISV